MQTSSASASANATRPRMLRLRFFELTLGLGASVGRQDEQQAAVVVVRREDVGLRPFGPVALRVNGNRLVEHPYAPLERRADVVVAALKVEPEHLLHGAADHVGVAEPGELPRTPARADQAALLVAD